MLNSEKEILSGLESSEISFRLAAIERAGREGDSHAVLEALLSRQERETDRELLLLLPYSIQKIRRRLGLESRDGSGNQTFNPHEFLKTFARSQPPQKLEMLANLKLAELKPLRQWAPDLLEKEEHPLVAANLVKHFGPHWPEEQFPLLTRNLGSRSLSLRLAVLEILVHRLPKELSKSLPKLLVSPDPRIRGLAIRGLAAIDFHEALAHHAYLLTSPHANDRMAAIENCFYFPFERIKPLLFKFVARETDAVLLTKVGVLFAINPDPEVPYRLWEMQDFSLPEKAAVLKSIIHDACQALEKSGRFSEAEHQTFMSQLSEWVEKKFAVRFVQDHLARLRGGDEDAREAEMIICRNLSQAPIRRAFEKALDWPLADAVKDRLRKLLAGQDSPSGVSAAGTEAPGAGSLPSQIRRLSGFSAKERDQARREIQAIFADANSTSAVIASSFRTAIRLELGDFSGVAKDFLRSSDPSLVAGAIEYLDQFHFELIYPRLKELVKSPDIRIKSVALRAFKKDDPHQAHVILRTMLFSEKASEQEMALSNMIYFDFPLVREMLLEFLSQNPTSPLFSNGMCLFSANPDPESLYLLYCLEQAVPASQKAQVAEVAAQNTAFLLEKGILSREELDQQRLGFSQRLDEDQRRQQGAPAPYSLEVLRDLIGRKDKGITGLLHSLWQWLRSFLGLSSQDSSSV
jgi:hypothetical protein